MLTNYLWLDWSAAARAAQYHPAMETLRISHGMLSPQMFIDALQTGQMEVLLMPNDAVALVSWGLCEDGKALHVLTMYTEMQHADETIQYIEAAARESGADCILAVTRHGWSRTAAKHDYDVHPCLFIKKVLHHDSIS